MSGSHYKCSMSLPGYGHQATKERWTVSQIMSPQTLILTQSVLQCVQLPASIADCRFEHQSDQHETNMKVEELRSRSQRSQQSLQDSCEKPPKRKEPTVNGPARRNANVTSIQWRKLDKTARKKGFGLGARGVDDRRSGWYASPFRI